MPTGYTYPVETGEITTVREYALRCARAFGACIRMRDDPMDLPPPRRIEPTSDYDAQIRRAQQVIIETAQMSDAECEAASRKEHAAESAQREQWAREGAAKEARYARMVESVNAWGVPEELASLKSFMLQQLSISRGLSPLDDMTAGPLSGEEWRKERILRAQRQCTWLTKQRDEEAERVKEVNAWLDLFWASLPAEEAQAADGRG